MKPIQILFATLALAFVATAQPRNLPAGYIVETVNIPKEITLGVGGMAFMDNNTLLICTREGEVWKFNTQDGQWELYADGLHESLGLWIDRKKGDVYVMQRPELTRLVDTNKDGKADLYQTVNAGWGLTDNYHEYTFGPVRDSKGNFYGTLNTSLSWPGWAGSDKWDKARVHDSKMGRAAKYRGWSFQITPQGKFVPYSMGMRSPAGIGINAQDDIFYTDNQGDWNETSTLHHVVKDRFHGHPSSYYDHPKYIGKDLNKISIEEYRKLRTRPSVFIPHGELANSPGEPVFDTTQGKFGPFAGQIILGDQTRSNLMRIHLEKVDGEHQGMVVNFISPCKPAAFAVCSVRTEVSGSAKPAAAGGRWAASSLASSAFAGMVAPRPWPFIISVLPRPVLMCTSHCLWMPRPVPIRPITICWSTSTSTGLSTAHPRVSKRNSCPLQ